MKIIKQTKFFLSLIALMSLLATAPTYSAERDQNDAAAERPNAHQRRRARIHAFNQAQRNQAGEIEEIARLAAIQQEQEQAEAARIRERRLQQRIERGAEARWHYERAERELLQALFLQENLEEFNHRLRKIG